MKFVSELLFFFCFMSFTAYLYVFPDIKHATPVHYNLWGEADNYWEHGLVIYPIVLFLCYVGTAATASSTKMKELDRNYFNVSMLITGLMLLVLQSHATYISLFGKDTLKVPTFFVPGLLLLYLMSLLVFLWNKKNAPPEPPKSPRTPRSLIKSLASDGEEKATPLTKEKKARSKSPARRRGRSRTPKRNVAVTK